MDWFPTLLEMTQVKPQRAVKFDGVDQTPVLLGSGTPRNTAVCYYPHYTPATGARPAISVRRGDWKLIRFYCDNRDQSDRFELYNLKTDLGETNDLAHANPDLVRQLNSLIDDFHRETSALVPAKNPAFDPNSVVPLNKRKGRDPAAPQKSATRDLRRELERESDAGTYSGS